MAQIRQEINIEDQSYSSLSSGVTVALGRILLDTTQYNGTVTYYFEVLASNNHASIAYNASLYINTNQEVAVSIPANSTLGLFRSASFTPTGTSIQYNIRLPQTAVAGNLVVKAARLVIIQNATVLTNTETQIEIGNVSSTTTTSDTALTNPKYWQYVSANWNGTITAYFEGTFATGNSKSAATMTLQESSSITAPSWSNVSGTAVTTIATTTARVRSSAFTLTAGNWYRAVMKAGNSKSGVTVYNAKVIIDQGLFSLVDSAAIGTLAWSNPINALGSNAVYAEASNGSPGSVVTHYLKATNFGFQIPSGATINGILVNIQKRSGASGITDNEVKIVKSDGTIGSTNKASATNWQTPEAYSSYGGSADLWGESWADTDINNTNFGVVISANVGAFLNAQIDNISITIYYNSGSSQTSPLITKLEPQYLLANTLFAAGTGLQTFLTDWDSTEWTGVSNTYTFQAEATDNSTSDVELWKADGSGSAIATVTNVDNAGQGAATMP